MENLNLEQTRTQLQNHQQTRQKIQDRINELSQQMLCMQESDKILKQREKLLDSLAFPHMNARKNAITDPHPTTFEWLFMPNDQECTQAQGKNSFQEWLRSDSKIYWISGKPGSGKSTLMNFIAEHDSTCKQLKKWSGPRDLIMIDGYLWNAGASSQRSYHGLLATLLSSIL